MLIVVNDGGIRKLPHSTEKAGAFSMSLTTSTGTTVRLTEVYQNATNNQMELLGMLTGVVYVSKYLLKNRLRDSVYLVSDSQLVMKGIVPDGYLSKWVVNGYRTTTGKPVSNSNIWQVMASALDVLRKLSDVKYYWVRGHLTEAEIEALPQPELKVFSRLNVRCDEALGTELDKEDYDETRYSDLTTTLQKLQQDIDIMNSTLYQ